MNANPTPDRPSRVVAMVDTTPASHRAVPVAIAVGSRLDVPIELALAPGRADDDASTLTALAERHGRLVVAGGPSSTDETGRPLVVSAFHPRRRLGAGSCRIEVGPAVLSQRHRRFEQLVVPLDGTPELDALVSHAVHWAEVYGLCLRVLGVVPDGPAPQRPVPDPTPRQRFALDPRALELGAEPTEEVQR